MIRLAGFLTGSVLAITAILLVLGVPEFRANEDETPAMMPPASPAPEAVFTELPPAEEPIEPVQVTATASPGPLELPQTPAAGTSGETNWHSFWSPFRSQIAANGFVSQLESVTGFDYRVVKVDPGTYEVAFAYDDENERDEILATIAAATGLDLPDS